MKFKASVFFIGASILFIPLIALGEANRYFATHPDYPIEVSINFGKGLEPGAGVDMSNPDIPVSRPIRAFDSAKIKANLGISLKGRAEYDSKIIEDDNLDEYSRTLYLNFSASIPGAGSLSAARKFAESHINTHKSIIIQLDKRTNGSEVDGSTLIWSSAPRSESSPEEERLDQFVMDYGSHYVSNTTNGYRVLIKAEVNSKDKKVREDFTANIKAFASSWSAQAGASSSVITRLKNLHTEVFGHVISGGISRCTDPKAAATCKEYDPVLQNLDQVKDFMQGIASRSIIIDTAPIQANVTSYWHTIDARLYPNTKNILKEYKGVKANSDFGVPSGTIIAWVPKNGAIEETQDGHRTYNLPNGGWVLCDGNNGTPNLMNAFPRGVREYDLVSKLGGKETHHHSGTTARVGSSFDGVDGGNTKKYTAPPHNHKFSTDEASSLPPYANVIFIMKL